jgi:hypothetical protein
VQITVTWKPYSIVNLSARCGMKVAGPPICGGNISVMSKIFTVCLLIEKGCKMFIMDL